MKLVKGDAVRYRAIAGDCYDAKVVGVRDDGTVDVVVACRPGDTMFLGGLTIHETKRACIWPAKRRTK